MSLEAFSRPGRFWKGNLHTHTDRSDGLLAPAEVCVAYRRAGYDFLCLSDHFLARYGWPVTEVAESARAGLTLLPGAELHAPATAQGELWHLLAVGLPADFAPPHPDETGPELAERCLAAGAFLAIPHPEWYGLTPEDAATIPGAHAVELYNHTSAVHAARGGGGYFLDALLNGGRRINALACDDAHFNVPDRPLADAFGAWVMVRATDAGPAALLDALKAGAYYATQGPEFRSVTLRGGWVELACSPVSHVALLGRGARVERLHGEALVEARLPLERFAGDWARLVLSDAAGRQAWSNPFWP